MTLTKDHIINSISNHLDFPKRTSAALFKSMLETIKVKKRTIALSGTWVTLPLHPRPSSQTLFFQNFKHRRAGMKHIVRISALLSLILFLNGCYMMGVEIIKREPSFSGNILKELDVKLR